MSDDATLDEFAVGSEESNESDMCAEDKQTTDDLQTLETSPIENWELLRLGDVLTFEYGDNLPADTRQGGEIPVYGSNGQVDTHTEANVDRAGIIIGRKGSIGEVEFSNEPFWAIDTTYYISSEETDENLRFIHYLLQDMELERLNAASAIPGLNRNDAYNLNTLVPPLSEQRKIATVLYTVDRAIEKTEEIIEQTHTVKDALMQDVFHGRHEDLKDYQSTPVGEIPSYWSVTSIGDVVRTAQYGISESMSEEGQYPIFRMNNIENGYMIDEPLKYIDLDDEKFEKYHVKKGDVLFNRTNSLELVGKTGIYELEDDHVFASYLIRLQTNNKADAYYLNYYMNSSEAQNRMMDFATKGVSQANINANSIQQVQIPLPPLDEQTKIADRIRAIDSHIKTNQRYKSQLKRLKQGIMQDLLSGTVRTTDMNIQIPEDVARHG